SHGWCPLKHHGAWQVLPPAIVSKHEKSPAYWNERARKTLESALTLVPITHRAKNIVLFLGDGMGISTVSAARIYKGQLEGGPGEDSRLAMETFPYVALAKTYSVDRQGGAPAGPRGGRPAGLQGHRLPAGAQHRHQREPGARGRETKSVGIVTTTRVQHASPGASYAHVVNREWYSDADLPKEAVRQGCRDIAYQLVHNTDINVILGGGRMYMTPRKTPDPEYPEDPKQSGTRKDGLNLVERWLSAKEDSRYVWNKSDLLSAASDPSVKRLMGLFEPGDMKYDLLRNTTSDPSLTQMTEAAIRILSRNPQGFYLFVEGGRIDHGHHDGTAHLALTEAVEFDRAVQRAGELTKEAETLTVAPSTHLALWVPLRPACCWLCCPWRVWLPNWYTSILYGNGPGYQINATGRPDVNSAESEATAYKQQAAGTPTSE
uniref:alkaline phosphatase n=1 Tax=Pelodiscus sinensis TaxID=13735 RepID=K7FSD7_PELSI